MTKTKRNGDPAAVLRAAAGTGSARAGELAREFTSRAADAGLLDVAYAEVDSPLGRLLVASTRRGLVRVGLPNQEFDTFLGDLSTRVSPRILGHPGRLDEVRRELELYFDGKLREFRLPLDWRLTAGFRRRVLRATARIPYGQTSSYTEVARRAGNERAMRAAGSALGSNPIPIVVPCHRVLRSGGALGGYGGGLEMKEALLELEGALG